MRLNILPFTSFFNAVRKRSSSKILNCLTHELEPIELTTPTADKPEGGESTDKQSKIETSHRRMLTTFSCSSGGRDARVTVSQEQVRGLDFPRDPTTMLSRVERRPAHGSEFYPLQSSHDETETLVKSLTTFGICPSNLFDPCGSAWSRKRQAISDHVDENAVQIQRVVAGFK